MNEQPTTLLEEAKQNGHNMARTSPDQYECTQCGARLKRKPGIRFDWMSIKTSNLCLEARVSLTELGYKFLMITEGESAEQKLVKCQ